MRSAPDYSKVRAAYWTTRIAVHFKKHRPNARPTQLNANIEEAIATTDTKVAMALTDGITEPRFRRRFNSVERVSIKARKRLDQYRLRLWQRCDSIGKIARKNPHLRHLMSESMGNQRYGRFVEWR
jgi:hypothetical protein